MQEQLFASSTAMRYQFMEELKDGEVHDCPCCGRVAKIYTRRVHKTIAWQLIKLYRLGGLTEYVHSSNLIPEGMSSPGDFVMAKHWGLIEAQPSGAEPLTDAQKTSGMWRLSAKGEQFIKGIVKIPEYLLIFDDTIQGRSETEIDIRQALTTKFNYHELMGFI